MDNLFITRQFYWKPQPPRTVEFINKLLSRSGTNARIVLKSGAHEMTSPEQRINLYHLVSQVLAYDVPGDLVELGSYTGETAVLLAQVMHGESTGRQLHLFDNFEWTPDGSDPRGTLERNFRAQNVPLPQIHQGLFSETVPLELPERIAFVNLDCGVGGPPGIHTRILLECLAAVYPRMPKGAVCSLIDYLSPDADPDTFPSATEVKGACDTFFADKPEKVSALFGGQFPHGYFRKL